MRPPPMAVEHGKNPLFPCITLTNNSPKQRFDLIAINGLDSKAKDAKSCDGSLGLMRGSNKYNQGMDYGLW